MKPPAHVGDSRPGLSSKALERRLLLGIGSTVLVLIVAVFSFSELSSLRTSKRWVEHSIAVIASLHEVQTTLLEAETAQRGYLVTGDPSYLGRHRLATSQTEAALQRVRVLTVDSPDQQARLDTLERDVRGRVAALDEPVRLHDAGERAASVALVRAGRGKRDMESALHGLDEMFAVEGSLLLTREAQHEQDLRLTTAIIVGGSVLAFGLNLAVNLGIRRGVLQRKRDQEVIDTQTRLIATQTAVLVENKHALKLRFDELEIVNAKLDAQLDALRVTGTALEKANRDLDHFAYAASHDLKGPLRGISSLSDWLEEDLAAVLTPKSKEHLRLLHGRIERMVTLIDGILAYARAARTDDEPETIELLPFLRGVVELVSPPPGVVTIDVPDSMPALTVQVAPFQQVWMNLLGNALKHGAKEGAAIRLAARDAGDAWELSVTDNGPGIPPEYQDRSFRMFHTLASRDKVEGAGIGLSIVQRLVDDRGGRVWVASEAGKGARFCFTWPKSMSGTFTKVASPDDSALIVEKAS